MTESTLRIGEVADKAGVSVSTIRFYERRGLLPEPERLGGQPKFVARVAKMAKHPDKKLLIVRQLVHSTRFKQGRPQSVFHIYRVRVAPR